MTWCVEFISCSGVPKSPGEKDAKVMITVAGKQGLVLAKMVADVTQPVRSAPAHVDALKLEIEAGLSTHDTAHWLTIFTGEGIPCGPYNDVAQALAEPQVKARNMVIAVDDPATGVLHLAGNPIKTSAFPDPTTRPAAPDLNADGARIRQELGLK